MKKLTNIQCEYCHKKFKPISSKTKYCSRHCSGRGVPHPKGASSPVWKGGIRHRPEGYQRVHQRGYIEVWLDGHWKLEHRLIMEKHLGRNLKNSEHVHHN
jgi:hypothetical protein